MMTLFQFRSIPLLTTRVGAFTVLVIRKAITLMSLDQHIDHETTTRGMPFRGMWFFVTQAIYL